MKAIKALAIGVSAAVLAISAAAAEQRTYDLGDFSKVSVATGISADITVGGDYSIVAESTEEELERLEVEVVDGALELRRRTRGFNWGRGDEIRVRISLPALDGLEASSGASADATGVDAGDFDAEASSGASLDIAGSCNALTLDVSSGGSIDAETFECRSATADASSGGSADLFASESLNADASSGGSIDVYGTPKNVNKDTSSGGSVSIE